MLPASQIQIIAKSILAGEHSLGEIKNKLSARGLPDSDARNIEDELHRLDDAEWQEAQNQDTIQSYQGYLDKCKGGRYRDSAQQKLTDKDEDAWRSCLQGCTAESLQRYKAMFPHGRHIAECETSRNDLPWLQLQARGSELTISDYEAYMNQYPGKHDAECRAAIDNIEDEQDWQRAQRIDTYDSYSSYLERHPNGKYADEAEEAVDNKSYSNDILREITADKNAYTATELNQLIGNHLIAESDLDAVFNADEKMAIRSFRQTDLPWDDTPPNKLIPGYTEVYFWGTPASGKTCAMGAILSAANQYGILIPQRCQGSGALYRDKLSNIFVSNGIAALPKGTPDECIMEMLFNLCDKNRKEHPIAFIDLAGELFRAIYHEENNQVSGISALKKTKEYLNNANNRKIHFFVVAYGEENKEWESITMSQYLNACAQYLKDHKIIKRGTNGVYILVTKCDGMTCAKRERQQKAEEYIKSKMPAFYNNLETACKIAGVADFGVIPFSVGDVFAQKLCHFESENTDAVLNKILLKSKVVSKGLIGIIKDFLNS